MKRNLETIFRILVFAAITLFAMLFFSCKTRTIYVPVEVKTVVTETVRDTVIQTKIEYIRDSVIVHIDSLSFLSNKYGYTYAEVKNGMLNHSLTTWHDSVIPIKIQYIDRYRVDSIPAPYPVEVEVLKEKEISLWQNIRMRVGEIAIGVILVLGIYFARKLFVRS